MSATALRPGRAGVLLGAGMLLLCSGAEAASTPSYPTRPVRLVVPSSPGGGTDIVGRIVAHRLAEQFGQQVVVDNRAGAGTIIGNDIVAKATPDGYTLLMGLSTLAINPSMFKKLPYEATRDFAPVSLVTTVPNILAVHPTVAATSVQQLIALVRDKPGSLLCGTAGEGTSPHLSAELFRNMARIQWQYVPYKGSGMGIVALLAGEVGAMFPSVPTAAQYVKAGRLRGLGVTTARRAQVLPDVPTIAEAGLPGYEATQWFGVLAPRGTPRAIIDLLHREIVRALAAPDVRARIAAEGGEIVGGTPEQFAAYLESETRKWADVTRAAGIKPQ